MPHFNFIKQEIISNTFSDLKVDTAFRKVPKNAISFAIWKIEDDHLEAVPRAQYGIFYDNCAYIIYAATTAGNFVNQETITRELKSNVSLARFIHFWLGNNVTEQNRSNVVHKVQELDSYLGHVAVVYRETQNHESTRFLSYFKKGYDVRSGALLNSTEKSRLYQLHGRKWLRCIELPNIAWTHFNADYIMVLKIDLKLFIWIGRATSSIERRSAIEWATKQQESKEVELLLVDDGYEQAMPEEHKRIWNTFLPLNERVVSQTAVELMNNDCYNGGGSKFRIYKCTHRGRLHLDQLDVVTPSKEDLSDSGAVYLLDSCGQGIWVWVGSQVPAEECLQAMGNGRAFSKKKKYPNSTLIVRVVEEYEPIEFKRLFTNWSNERQEGNCNGHKPVSTKFGKLDAISLCERPRMAAETQLIDNGSGERILYHINDQQINQMLEEKFTIFTKNNCYVMKYSVVCATPNPADLDVVGIKTIIYQWNGSNASTQTLSAAEIFAKTCFEQLTEKGIFVQLCEFHETPHFLQIFDGKLIVLQGSKNSLLNLTNSNSNNKKNNSNNNNNIVEYTQSSLSLETFLLKITGDASYNSKAVELFPLTTISSKECYIIKTNNIWVWCGQSSTGDAREMAKSVGSLFGECLLMLEGKESKEFWQSVSLYFNQPLIVNGIKSCSNSVSSKCNSSSSNTSISSKSSCNNNNSTSSHSNSNNHNCNIMNTTISNYSNSCYLNTPSIVAKSTGPPAQLFLVWYLHDLLHKREIFGYEQNDLHSDCMYVLDAGSVVYVWLGAFASRDVKEQYLKLGQKYLDSLPLERHSAAALIIVLQHDEPNIFKGFFNDWNTNLWKKFVPYEKQRKQFNISNGTAPTKDINAVLSSNSKNCNLKLPASLLNCQMDFDRHHKFPISLLQSDIDCLPSEINPLKRELHLTHDDFVALFKMPYWDFEELPNWKKQELKKKYKLF